MFDKIKKFINRIKQIWNLPEENEQRYRNICTLLGGLETRVNERCEVHADIHYKEPHQIIVVGKYKGRDYVRVYGVSEPSFINLIERLNYEEKGSKVGRFDFV